MLNIKNTAIAAIVIISTLLVGCGEEKLRTGDYYKENPKELGKMIEKCKAEHEKGYKPEGNFGENCNTAKRVQNNNQRNAIISAIRG